MPHFKIKLRDSGDDGGIAGTHSPLAGREAILARARVDAERWVDDGGSFRAEGVPSAPRDELVDVTAGRPGKN